MSNTPADTSTVAQRTSSWLPLIVVVLTQIQASFAVNALTVSMAGITTDLDTAATSVGTAITAGTFAMAAFILLGAKVGARFGTRTVFQIAVALHALAMVGVATSQSPGMLFVAQALSGAVIALVAPALTVFIAANYEGDRQAKAIGYLAAAIPLAGVMALVIAGWFAETIGWRWSFWLIVILGVLNLLLSFRVPPVAPQPKMAIDWIGAIIAACTIIALSFGFSGMNTWGVWAATPGAPFDVFGISPAPLLILLGAIGGQLFFVWIRRRQKERKSRIFDIKVLATSQELAVTACMAAMLFVGTAANFLVPLYMQIVQGLTGTQTSFSIIPYTISIFVASTFVAYLYRLVPARILGALGFAVVAAALVLLASTIRGEWGQAFIVLGLVLLGLGQGSIVALVFNTLLSAAPKQLAGDVGAWRGLVHNLSGSVGIAVASAFAVGVLSATLASEAKTHPDISDELISQISFSEVDFMTNDQLELALGQSTATETEIATAIEINEEARLRSLQWSLLGLAAISALAIVPATRMPAHIAGNLPPSIEPDDNDDIDENDLINPTTREESS